MPGSRPPWPRVDGRRPCRVGPGPAAPATLDRSHVRSAKPARPGRGAAGMSELQVSSQLGPCLARPVADREVERDQRQHLVERSERGPAGPCLPRADGRGRDAEPTSESSLTPPASTANEPNEIGGLHAVNPGRSRRGHERDFGVLWTHGALVHLSRPRMSNCPRSVGDRDARDRVPTTGCRPPDADHRMPTTGCRPPAADDGPASQRVVLCPLAASHMPSASSTRSSPAPPVLTVRGQFDICGGPAGLIGLDRVASAPRRRSARITLSP
ncbi:MAG: hypothetical protein JWN77_3302 [Frankiales bacterium]|nr:hypothetical protein [Frankiales bacterium]